MEDLLSLLLLSLGFTSIKVRFLLLPLLHVSYPNRTGNLVYCYFSFVVDIVAMSS